MLMIFEYPKFQFKFALVITIFWYSYYISYVTEWIKFENFVLNVYYYCILQENGQYQEILDKLKMDPYTILKQKGVLKRPMLQKRIFDRSLDQINEQLIRNRISEL